MREDVDAIYAQFNLDMKNGHWFGYATADWGIGDYEDAWCISIIGEGEDFEGLTLEWEGNSSDTVFQALEDAIEELEKSVGFSLDYKLV